MLYLILHLVGDYVTQSDWMANNKSKAHLPAFIHALVYALPFLFFTSLSAWLIIFGTHFLIDRYRLVRRIVWAKNIVLSPALFIVLSGRGLTGSKFQNLRWENCKGTGYPSERDAWMVVWLMIAADNTLHLAINSAAIHYLP